EGLGYVDHLNRSVVLEVRDERESGLPWKPTGLRESNEFRQDITMRQSHRGGLEEPDSLRMLRLGTVGKPQQARSVQDHQWATSWEEPYSRAKSASMLSLSAPVGFPRSTAPA